MQETAYIFEAVFIDSLAYGIYELAFHSNPERVISVAHSEDEARNELVLKYGDRIVPASIRLINSLPVVDV